MIHPWEIETSEEVDEWADRPHSDPTIAASRQRKLLRASERIRIAGILAGDAYLKKLRDDLYETTIDDQRIMSTIQGRNVIMVTKVEKKKGKLSARQLDNVQRRVADYMARRG